MEHELSDAIRKVAVGYSLEEVTEEYGVEDGQVKLLKRKETRKAVPPDLRAVKMLLEGEGSFGSMTDEELFAERERLLKVLAEEVHPQA
jgi:hypothetical protein